MPPAGEPLEAQQREQRLAERGLADPHPALDRVGHAERAEAVSSCARWRSTLGQTSRISSGFVPARISCQHLVARRARACRARRLLRGSGWRPWSAGAAAAGRRRGAARGGRAPAARSRRSPAGAPRCVPRRARRGRRRCGSSDSNGARFGSYGSETVTSVRPASASRAPIARRSGPRSHRRSTGRPDQASSSPETRSAACRLRRSRSQSSSLSSSAR